VVINIGEPAEGAWFPERLPRLDFDQAARII
jgi:hypothetical protein